MRSKSTLPLQILEEDIETTSVLEYPSHYTALQLPPTQRYEAHIPTWNNPCQFAEPPLHNDPDSSPNKEKEQKLEVVYRY